MWQGYLYPQTNGVSGNAQGLLPVHVNAGQSVKVTVVTGGATVAVAQDHHGSPHNQGATVSGGSTTTYTQSAWLTPNSAQTTPIPLIITGGDY